jgi:hypothetical protein
MVTKDNCRGCRDDFYNDRNPLGVKECWMFKAAKLVDRYRTHRDAMPASKGAFAEVRVPSCFNQTGVYFVKTVPDFVKPEDIVRAKIKHLPDVDVRR